VTEQSEHLSSAQIENYGNRSSGAGPDADQPDEALRINAHLESCPSCRSRLLDFHRASFGLLADPQQLADVQVNTASTPECPSDDDLRQFAAGLLPDAVATRLTQHATTCDHCGPLLRTFTEDFSDDFTPEEQAALANLQTSSAAWQKNTARRMLEAGNASVAAAVSTAKSGKKSSAERPTSSALDRKPFFWKWILVPATAAVVAVAAFSIWYTQRDTPEKVEKLLAQAYTEDRTTELRWPGAEYANIRQTRSGESGSILSVPESLRNAANKIDLSLRKNPDDSKWLLLSARLHLIEGHYQPAITDLNKIDNERAAGTSDYLITRALALYEKGESEPNGRQFYGEAVDLLGKVLQQNPDNPAALFNQALACEKIFAFNCAVSDWERLLKVEKDSNWAHEAQQHLIRIQKKKKLER
jgi:tetratricopeptide (TPR) repeat protein